MYLSIICFNCHKKHTFQPKGGGDRKRKFCSRSCAITHNNKNRKVSISHRTKITNHFSTRYYLNPKHCKVCNAILSFDLRNKTFCSKECSKNRVYTDDQVFSENSPANYGTVRDRFLLYTEYKCNICGLKEWNNQRITLQLDHINGNHFDHKKENLRLLCPNCHSQTPSFGIGHKRLSSGSYQNRTDTLGVTSRNSSR